MAASRKIFFIVLIVITPVLMFGNSVKSLSPKSVSFRNYSIEEGLVSTTVNCIYQDHQGFIWIGTDNGLSRFDGYEFVNFKADRRDPNSLYSDNVKSIYEDSRNRLWIGTTSSLECMVKETEQFVSKYPVSPENTMYVEQFYENSRGTLWAATATEGLLEYNCKKDTFESSPVNSWTSGMIWGINDIVEDDQGDLWVATEDSGVYRLDLNTKEMKHFIHQPGNSNSLPDNSVRTLEIDEKNNIWMATYGGGICRYNPNDKLFTRYQSSSEPGTLNSNLVLSLLIDENENLWVISEAGLDRFSPETNTFYNFHHIEGDPKSLANNKLWSIYKDRIHNLWIGHCLGGLSFFDYNNLKSFYTLSKTSYPIALNNNYVRDITKDHRGNIWIGTDGGGINILDRSGRGIETIRYSNSSEATNSVMTFLKHSNGNIYFGTYLDGLQCYDPETGHIGSFNVTRDPMVADRQNDIRAMAEDRNGYIWTVTHGDGINVFDPAKKEYIHHYGNIRSDIEGLMDNNWINAIHIDENHHIWIGSFNGLKRFNPRTKEITHYRKTDEDGLISNTINYISQDREGKLLVGTDEGLCIYDAEYDTFDNLTQEDGLAHNMVRSVVVDDENNYWLATFNGLSKYVPGKSQIFDFHEADGLSGNQFLRGAAYKSEEGEIFLGTTKGMTYFDPEKIAIDSTEALTRFTALKIFNHKVKPGEVMDGVQILNKTISLADTIFLDYRHNMFSIGFAALHYISPEENRYKYMLEGFDKTWIHTDVKDRMATYTNLKPGTYLFKVLASNGDGIWSSQPETLTIEIIPPFWMELWFKAVVIGAILILLVSFYYYRINRMKRLNRILNKEVEDRTREISQKNKQLEEQTSELKEVNTELEERQMQIEEQDEELKTQNNQLEKTNMQLEKLNSTKDNFFSIISHDLKNPINNILGFSSFYIKKFDELDERKKLEFVEHIHFSGNQIHNLLGNLLTWSRNQQGSIEFNPDTIVLQQLFDESMDLMKNEIQEKNLQVDCNIIPNLKVYGDFNMLYTVLRNLLSNAVKFTPENGKITIETRINNEDKVRISMTDSGMGIPKEVKKNLFDMNRNISSRGTRGEKGSGLGLIICKEFIEKHGQNLYIENGKNEGTTFSFYLPVVKE